MEKCFVIFPGKFKPVHSGHISLIEKYLSSTDYDVDLTIVISKMNKEGLNPETSKWFLDKIYAKRKNVHIVVSPDPSPIGTVYNIVGQKEYGDGIYAMGTSAKGGDIKRAEDFVKKFTQGEKYYTEGVKAIFFPIEPTPLNYSNRNDLYAGAPISSTIVRADIRNNDFEAFKTAYVPSINSELGNIKLLKEYFEKLKVELLQAPNNRVFDSVLTESYLRRVRTINEGGAAGHMEHPYDVQEFTFGDLKELITDLFAGRITDITEKLDGQNIFASVNMDGNTVFARSAKDINYFPLSMQDIKTKWIDSPNVQHAFSNAADTIDNVFKKIPNAKKFFNEYRQKWLNIEILDTQNFNVIPYVESVVSFHEFKEIDEEGNIIPDPNNVRHLAVLQDAIEKTNKSVFKAQITPHVIFKKINQGEKIAQKYIAIIDKLTWTNNLSDRNTISDYKETCLRDHIAKSSTLSFIHGEILEMLINRWVNSDKSRSLTYIKKVCRNGEGRVLTKEEGKILSEFDKVDYPLLMKKIIAPLDKLFMGVGNEAIKSMQGLVNSGREKEVISVLKKEIKDLTSAINNSDDYKSKTTIEKSLARLSSVNNELNATEGVVFDFKGHKLKLTGSFAPLNQLLGVKYKLKNNTGVQEISESMKIPRRKC